MKIIFLDIDGVLTSRNSDSFIFECESHKYNLQSYNMECLKHILNNVKDSCIVLSSSWRNYPDNHIMIGHRNGIIYKNLIPKLRIIFGNDIIGNVPHKDGANKYSDISDYLSSNQCEDFVVLDDDPSQGLEGFGKQFFKINNREGLTLEIAKNVVKYFNE